MTWQHTVTGRNDKWLGSLNCSYLFDCTPSLLTHQTTHSTTGPIHHSTTLQLLQSLLTHTPSELLGNKRTFYSFGCYEMQGLFAVTTKFLKWTLSWITSSPQHLLTRFQLKTIYILLIFIVYFTHWRLPRSFVLHIFFLRLILVHKSTNLLL